MVQKIHPRGVIWVPSNRPQAGHLSEKNDDLAVQYEDVHGLVYMICNLKFVHGTNQNQKYLT